MSDFSFNLISFKLLGYVLILNIDAYLLVEELARFSFVNVLRKTHTIPHKTTNLFLQ